MKKVISDFDDYIKAFSSAQKNYGPVLTRSAGMSECNEVENQRILIMAAEKKAPRSLVRTESRLAEVEGKVDSLVTAFQDL